MGGVDEYCTLTLLKAVHHLANAPRLVLLLAQGKVSASRCEPGSSG
jgi:hypothetical protein